MIKVIVLLIIVAILIGLLIWWYNYSKIKTEENYKLSNDYKQKKKDLDEELKQYRINTDENINHIIATADQQIEAQNKALAALKEQEEQIINQRKEIIHNELEKYWQEQNDILLEYFNKTKENANNEIDKYLVLINEKENQLEDFKKKQASINEMIRLREAEENEIDFHRIILTKQNKEDIEYLLSIEDKINNKQLLHKLIWSEYLQKPFNNMIKNQFGSSVPKGVIYCIENLNTHKKYIGRTSAEVSKRWTEHIKTTLGLGSVRKSDIHTALFGHWDEFVFSVIEVVDPSKLSEREKYYIGLFETDKFGYNMNSGG